MQHIKKHIKKILVVIIYFASCFSVNAQIMFQRTYIGPDTDWGNSIIQMADSGYIIAGATINFGAGWGNISLLRLDAYGDTLWTKTYGGTGVVLGSPTIIQTTAGDFVIAATTDTFGAGDEDIYVIKTNPNGDTLWTKTYGGVLKDECRSIIETSDNGYLITGSTQSYGNVGFNYYDVYIIRTDENGDTLWTKTIGGSMDDKGVSAIQTADGKFAVCGNSTSFGIGSSDIYLNILDSNGVLLLTKIFGNLGHEYTGSIILTDSGFAIGGMSSSFGGYIKGLYIIQTDFNWDTIWTMRYIRAGFDNGFYIQQCTDGGFVMTGNTKSSSTSDWDVVFIKTDRNGDLQFVKTYGGNSTDDGLSVLQTFDGGFIIIGNSQSFGAVSQNIFLIKTDDKGNVYCNEGTYNPSVSRTPTVIGTGGTVSAGGIVNSTSTVTGSTNFVENVLCDTCTGPVAGFYYIDSLLSFSFIDSSQGVSSRLWDFGDGNTSNLANPLHTFSNEGTYTVCLTVINDCGTDSVCRNINTLVPVREALSGLANIRIRPNPYLYQTKIIYSLSSGKSVVIDAYNLMGEKIETLVNKTQLIGNYTYNFSAAKLGYPPGIYIIKLIFDDTMESRMVIELN